MSYLYLTNYLGQIVTKYCNILFYQSQHKINIEFIVLLLKETIFFWVEGTLQAWSPNIFLTSSRGAYPYTYLLDQN